MKKWMKKIKNSQASQHSRISMINKRSSQPGYIMILTLTLTALASLILAIVFQKSTVFSPFAKMSVDRQHARTLAQSGISIVISQLVQSKKNPKEQNKTLSDKSTQQSETQSKEESDTKRLFENLLPVLNKWQEFRLTQETDQIDGLIEICIMSEEGKININEIFDFEQKQIKGSPSVSAKDSQDMSTKKEKNKVKKQTDNREIERNTTAKKNGDQEKKEIDWYKPSEVIFKSLEQKTGQKDLLKQLEQFLQKNEKPLNDVTQLLEIKSFSIFKNNRYYEPPSINTQQKNEKQRPLFLTDIFTTHTNNSLINPWLLSDSLRGILGENRVQIGNEKEFKEQIKEWLVDFKEKVTWQKDWQQQTGKMLKKISPEIQKKLFPIFTESIEPTVFSALVKATVNDVNQQLFVILERTKGSQNDKTLYDINIRRFYWV
jgi:hypothetical protein